MTGARLFAALAAVALCAGSGGDDLRAPSGDERILPDEAIEIIESTPCPEAAGASAEACLLWLTPDASAPDAVPLGDARRVARDVGGRGTVNARDPESGAIASGRDGLRGRTKSPR